MDIKAIRQGLSDAASAVPAGAGLLRCYARLPGAIQPPVFAPVEYEVAYHKSFSPARGLSSVTVTCGIYTPDSEEGGEMLDLLVAEAGAGSVPAALEANKTLGGAAKTLVVRRVRGADRLYTVGDVEYLGAMVDVEVYA